MTILAVPQRICHYETQYLDPATLLASFGERGAWFAARVTALDMGHDPGADPLGNESVFITFTVNGAETYYATQWHVDHADDLSVSRKSVIAYYSDPNLYDNVDEDELEFLAHDGNILPLRDLNDLITALADAVRA